MRNRILVDLSNVHEKGKERESVALYAFRFLNSIPESLRENFTLFVERSMENTILDKVGAFRTEYFHDIPSWIKKIPGIKSVIRRMFWTKQVNKLHYDCVYLPFSWSANSGKINKRKIITVHDLRPMRDQLHQAIRKKISLHKLFYVLIRNSYRKQVKNADTIIVISNYIKNDIAREWPGYEDKIVTIYNSVNADLSQAIPVDRLKGKKFLLYVNTITPYKNLITLIRAFRKLSSLAEYSDLNLVVVGKETEYWKSVILPFVEKNVMNERIIRLNYVTDEELKWLYDNALIFITTSTCEGFGYTPIEAAICGCPVISTRCDSLPDVTCEKVTYYEPPTSEEELLTKIRELLAFPPEEEKLQMIADFFKHRYSVKKQVDSIVHILSQS